MYAFINLAAEDQAPIRVRFDLIAALEERCNVFGEPIDGARVTLAGGGYVTGSRSVAEVWQAMREAAEWLGRELVDPDGP